MTGDQLAAHERTLIDWLRALPPHEQARMAAALTTLIQVWPSLSLQTVPARRQRRGSDPSLLTVKDVAEELGVNTRTVHRLVERRQLEAIRVGRQFRIRPRALADYMWRSASTKQVTGQ